MTPTTRRASSRHQPTTPQDEQVAQEPASDYRAQRDAPTPGELDPEPAASQHPSTLGKRAHSPEAPGPHRPPPPAAMDTDDDPEPSTPTQPTYTSTFATANPFEALHPDTPVPSAQHAAHVSQPAPSVETLREQLNNATPLPTSTPVDGIAASMHAPREERDPSQRISRTLVEEDQAPDPFPALTPPFRIPAPSTPNHAAPSATQEQQARTALIRSRIAASASYVSTANLPELGAADPLALTSPPFPLIHQLYPAQAWEGVLHTQVEAWLTSAEGESLLLRTFATTAHLTNNQQLTVGNIGRVLTAYIGVTNPKVFPPIPSETARATNRLPKVFLVQGLTAEEAAAILAGNVFSTPLVTFQALPLEPQIPHLILALAGFLDTATEADVLATVIETWNKPHTLGFLDDLMESTMTTEKPLTVTQLHPYLSSIDAVLVPTKAAEGHPTPRFSIVAKRLTLVDDEHWFQLVAHFKSLSYPSNFHGTGRATNPMFCPLCNGCDHPRGLCGFPNLTGWNGEGHDAPRPPPPPHHGDDRDRRQRNKAPYNGARTGRRA
ncbi:hypothetical protein FA95DRAFT_1574436 [Auriscalpium vulgare]|uniref:Uncharacterized protein n=1 Tax=Auriscalpium vulgare TaxID=40419 RepID=A0ACB8RJZ1_9AGAM|nr:hypothetical protein FA95DRAFT_1574436 [Auriscalpium vulgare]